MKKVGILSMQRIANYGSFLQAYGLKSILEELDCQVQFVDYRVGPCLVDADGGYGIVRKLAKVAEVFRYRAPLADKLRFIKYKKNYTSNYYPMLGISDEMNYTPELDLLVIGSDEVFNCVQSNTNVGFSPELFGQNHRAKRLISYAGSFGNTTLEKLEQYKVAQQVASYFQGFDAISVRDDNSGKTVETLTGRKPEYHLDPVLAYDYMGKCEKIPQTVQESGYMLLYGYSGRISAEECKAIRAYANRKGLKVYCIGGVQDCCDKFIDCNPFEVIAYFRNAECIVTDTFHGTIMSVITHSKFATLIRKSGYGNSEKLTDLLKRLKLECQTLDRMDRLDEILGQDIPYAETDRIIQAERERTYQYLRDQID